MFLRLARILLAGTLMLSIGLHWAALQMTGWLGMMVTYSVQEQSVIEGLAMTFDGDHPCPFCTAVKEGTRKEKKTPTTQVEIKKMNMLAVTSELVLHTPPFTLLPRAGSQSAEAWRERPDAPPPRCGAA